jgi:RNA polymerase sigma-70 factor (ECF subfamily)
MTEESSGPAPATMQLVARAAGGNERAFEDLIRHVAGRLLRLTRRVLRGYPHLHRWEETDDVFQGAVLRLYRSLRQTQPESVQHFWNLAALQVPRTLIDLARRHYGPEGQAAHYHSDSALGRDAARDEIIPNTPQPSAEPQTLDAWCDFHEAVDRLPEPERDVFQFLWYAGLTQAEAASALGVSLPTVQRRWYAAQVSLFQALKGQSPEGADK